MSTDKQNTSGTILIVDDETGVRRSLAILLDNANYTIMEAEASETAATLLNNNDIDLAVIDMRLGDESGIDLVRQIRQNHPNTESILLTAYGSIESSVEAMKAGAYDYITKPFSDSELLLRVNKALERKKMKEEIITLKQQVAMSYGFDNIVGISKQIRQVKETARRIAATDITVLITGASGTGKELFARAIHHHSHRRNGPLIAVDCSAIPETLLESELFGHVKGAFTSASSNKKGLFEEADGGTLFLDEVSNMPAPIQVKLLRFLQDSVVRQVGSSTSRKVNVRILAASNRDLATMVSQGEFREDLYYRLNVIPLNLPSLMERAEDIEILTEYFMRKIADEMDRSPMDVKWEGIEKLRSHNWPGNVRELENTLKRATALCANDHLGADDITFVASENGCLTAVNSTGEHRLKLTGNLLDDNQRSLIIKALNDNNWNYTKTATELGIGRTTLWRKVKKYELRREPV